VNISAKLQERIRFANPVRTLLALRPFVPSWTTNQRLTLNGHEIRSWKDTRGFVQKDSFVEVRIAPKAGDVLEYDYLKECARGHNEIKRRTYARLVPMCRGRERSRTGERRVGISRYPSAGGYRN
jgi:hypothetical protein